MHRLRKFALAALVALTFTACDEGEETGTDIAPPAPAVGTISGTVTIDGAGATGITATLSSGATTATGAGGTFSFAGVEAGSYTVTISGFPADAAFPSATQAATIASDGQTVQLNFAGEYIRSSSVAGSVVAADPMLMGSDSNGDGRPDMLDGITVELGGEHAMAEPQLTSEGGFAFTGLRAGSYTVTISGYPDDVKFDTPSMTVEVGVGDVGMANFEGAYIRTAAVEGRVIIEGEGLAGVTVTLTGGPGNDNYTKLTGDTGEYAFTELRPGDYQVSISGYDADDYEFASSSHDVSVELDETETVSFTGVLLRTSGISGRVSVEGMGLADVAVTLSGAADATTTTDASGQYAFAGLAAGDYSVTIAVEDAAYVFASMSSDVTVGDDDSRIANFEGAHATTASVSGMLFIDEATKNDSFDAGETPLARAGVPVVLVGPGVNDQRLSATNADGQFMFSGLRAGPYRLVVPIGAQVAAALAAADLAYGGPATGYELDLGVGEAASQAVPFDITHTTVNFTVSLKSGEETGDALPGATVTLYSDAAGTTRVGGGETGDDGSVAIRVARAGTSGNTVHAGVSADGYKVIPPAGRTAVSWNPQMFATAGANDNDIVNLNVDVTVGGETITTDAGGGVALAGWAIDVTSGEDAVEGAPEALDDDGNAAFTATVAAADLPASYSFNVADDQDDDLDGGEAFEGTSVEYTHSGLLLAGSQDAGSIEVRYTTQTLKVYVHHERDQVVGYTGNILGSDERMSGMIDVDIRYIDGSGRSRAFTSADGIGSSEGTGANAGVYTFSNVPAGEKVIVQAEEAAGVEGIMLLDNGGHRDELSTYRNLLDNGVTGGAFGDMGGFSHTVELCPLQSVDPTGQDHGECGSFAYVSIHNVSGTVWKVQVVANAVTGNDDSFTVKDPVYVPGITVNLDPVEGKNIAGDAESYTTLAKDDSKTKKINETHQFDFGEIAAGVYTESVLDGWRVRMGEKGAEAMVGYAFNPLARAVVLDVTPATGIVYGYVRDAEDFPVPEVTVTANGVSAETDVHGRYIAEGISAETRKGTSGVFVETDHEANEATTATIAFAANSAVQQDIELSGVGKNASISGKVTASGSGAPVAGAAILVDGVAPQNAATKGANKGKLVTGADGTYTAMITAKAIGESAKVSVSRAGMSFVPADQDVPAHGGAVISGIDFTGFLHATISGRVKKPDGNAMGDVSVTATNVVTSTATPVSSTTNARGTFVLSVPFGAYDLKASADDHTFTYPNNNRRVQVAPGQALDFGDIQAMSPAARDVTAERLTKTDEKTEATTYTGEIEVSFTASAMDVPDGYGEAEYEVQHKNGSGTFKNANAQAVENEAGDKIPGMYSFTGAPDAEFMVRVVATAKDSENVLDIKITSDPVTVSAIDPSASGVDAKRGVRGTGGAAVDTLGVTWKATTNNNSQLRVLVEVSVTSVGTVWLEVGETIKSVDRSWTTNIEADKTKQWEALNGDKITITAADLNKALRVRVDARQDKVDVDVWKEGTPVTVAAKPSS